MVMEAGLAIASGKKRRVSRVIGEKGSSTMRVSG